jgi:hypothetical protein
MRAPGHGLHLPCGCTSRPLTPPMPWRCITAPLALHSCPMRFPVVEGTCEAWQAFYDCQRYRQATADAGQEHRGHARQEHRSHAVEPGAYSVLHGVPLFPSPCAVSITASRARSAAGSASSAAASDSREFAFAFSPSLVQALVQAFGGLSVSPLSAPPGLRGLKNGILEVTGSIPVSSTPRQPFASCRKSNPRQVASAAVPHRHDKSRTSRPLPGERATPRSDRQVASAGDRQWRPLARSSRWIGPARPTVRGPPAPAGRRFRRGSRSRLREFHHVHRLLHPQAFLVYFIPRRSLTFASGTRPFAFMALEPP